MSRNRLRRETPRLRVSVPHWIQLPFFCYKLLFSFTCRGFKPRLAALELFKICMRFEIYHVLTQHLHKHSLRGNSLVHVKLSTEPAWKLAQASSSLEEACASSGGPAFQL